jgi:hypothetical protein
MKNPTEVFNHQNQLGQENNRQFGHFVQFDKGKCTAPGPAFPNGTISERCADWWDTYGYMVGCQTQSAEEPQKYKSAFSSPIWYSLPGRCPSLEFAPLAAKKACAAEGEVGGECPRPEDWPEVGGRIGKGSATITNPDGPMGTRQCTWKLQEAGAVNLDKLVGIDNYQTFCQGGKAEYDPLTDDGIGNHFWKGKTDQKLNEERVMKLMSAFKELNLPDFPNLP